MIYQAIYMYIFNYSSFTYHTKKDCSSENLKNMCRLTEYTFLKKKALSESRKRILANWTENSASIHAAKSLPYRT